MLFGQWNLVRQKSILHQQKLQMLIWKEKLQHQSPSSMDFTSNSFLGSYEIGSKGTLPSYSWLCLMPFWFPRHIATIFPDYSAIKTKGKINPPPLILLLFSLLGDECWNTGRSCEPVHDSLLSAFCLQVKVQESLIEFIYQKWILGAHS